MEHSEASRLLSEIFQRHERAADESVGFDKVRSTSPVLMPVDSVSAVNTRAAAAAAAARHLRRRRLRADDVPHAFRAELRFRPRQDIWYIFRADIILYSMLVFH